MKAYKLIEKVNDVYTKDRIFVKLENGSVILLGNFTQGQQFVYNMTITQLKEKLIEIELEDEKWIHPHLYKPLKSIIVKG